METKHILFALTLLLLGCDRCYGLQLPGPDGARHRILQRYVTTYGCASFDDVATTDDMAEWCAEHELGDTVAWDVAPGCRPGESVVGGCEAFWVCE